PLLELGVVHLQQRPVRAGVGVVDQDVDAAERLGDPLDKTGDGLGVGDVAGERLRPRPAFADQLTGRRKLRPGASEHGDRRALGREGYRDALPQSLPSTGDDPDLAAQASQPLSLSPGSRPARPAVVPAGPSRSVLVWAIVM